MNVEESIGARARRHAALGEPVRLAIADALALSDVSPRYLAKSFGLASNLLAHHLSVLEAAGLVARSRSESDRRRSYVRLLPAARPFVRPAARPAARVVFVCTQNSARSQLAAALWAGRATLPVASAGTRPAARVHPRAVAVAGKHGLDLRGARTAHIGAVVHPDDLVVTVCDTAHEELARTADVPLHWSVADPAARDDSAAFDVAFDDLASRVSWLAATMPSSPEEATNEGTAT